MTERVDAGKPVVGPFSIDLDSENQPAILFGQYDKPTDLDELWIARRSGDSWQHDQLASGCEIFGNALVLDAQDMAHAVFSENCDNKLSYAYEGDSGWQTAVVTNNGSYPSLALDGADRPHVVYRSSLGQIYATLTGTNWETTVVQEGLYAGGYNTLILDKAGAAHISSLSTDLYYATNGGGQWQVRPAAVQDTVGLRNALALDSADTPHALYHKAEALPFETVEALTLGADDKPYFLHSESTWTNPKYPFLYVTVNFAARDAAGWHNESFWSEEYLDWHNAYWDGQARLVVDEQGRAHIAMRTADFGYYYYVQRDNNGAWRSENSCWLGLR